MHKLNLPYTFELTGTSLADRVARSKASGDLIEKVRVNKIAVIECALALERNLVAFISDYFFGGHWLKPPDPKKATFIEYVLEANWCTFSNKIQLTLHIVRKDSLFSDLETLKKTLYSIMDYRNAFTHGTIKTDGTTCWLSYFKNGPQSK
jgi:hypothetical protein